jgi:transmembrane sensor
MKTVIPFPDPARIDEAAATWVARLDRGDLTSDERDTLRSWLAADPRHRAALARMARLWNALDCLTILAELFPQHPVAPAPRQSRRWLPAAMAATMVLAVALGLALRNTPPAATTDAVAMPASATAAAQQYRTALGERMQMTLADGSVLTLNTQSEVRVRFDTASRSVELLHGEAYFKVAKDTARPFVVHAGGGSVRALGTAFNVRVADDQVEVLVDEGSVEVQPEERHNGDATRPDTTGADTTRRVQMHKGDTLRFNGKAMALQSLEAPAIARRLAWRSGKWIFEGETLAEVLREVARHSDRRIVIADPALASLRIGGYFDVGDVDGLMAALEAGFGIVVEREGDALHLAAAPRATPSD